LLPEDVPTLSKFVLLSRCGIRNCERYVISIFYTPPVERDGTLKNSGIPPKVAIQENYTIFGGLLLLSFPGINRRQLDLDQIKTTETPIAEL
jgi:hypothetical protein